MFNRYQATIIAIVMLISFSGCFSSGEQKGVTNKWRDPSLPSIEKGQTTQSEILELFGPPSQIINLGDQSVFYYVLEKARGRGAFLLVFNWKEKEVSYDRAIFFFDSDGVLTDYAYSNEKVEYESEP